MIAIIVCRLVTLRFLVFFYFLIGIERVISSCEHLKRQTSLRFHKSYYRTMLALSFVSVLSNEYIYSITS